jgi:hypothetical protein
MRLTPIAILAAAALALGGRRVLLRRVSAPIDPQGSC